MNTPFVPQYHFALIDTVTSAVLTIGTSPAVMTFLKECTSDTWIASSINYPNYMEWSFLPLPFFMASLEPEEYPKWTWDFQTRRFFKTKKELLDESLLSRARLAEAKRDIITKMISQLNLARSSMLTGISFQDSVYHIKVSQAQAFKDTGYDEDRGHEFLYVMQYADHAGISLRQAADDILLKAKFDEELLLKSEFIRLKYFDKVRKATTIDELPTIFEEFERISYLNV